MKNNNINKPKTSFLPAKNYYFESPINDNLLETDVDDLYKDEKLDLDFENHLFEIDSNLHEINDDTHASNIKEIL